MTQPIHRAQHYLYDLYAHFPNAQKIHLDGGAALSFIYQIDQRHFSNDLDFTIETQAICQSFIQYAQAYFLDKNPSFKTQLKPNSIIYQHNEQVVLSIDYYLVPAKYCQYTQHQYKIAKFPTISLSAHAIEDIFVEKLFCTIDRTEMRDLADLQYILQTNQLNPIIINQLFHIKQAIKQSPYPTLPDYLNHRQTLQNKYTTKFPDHTMQIIDGFNYFIDFLIQN